MGELIDVTLRKNEKGQLEACGKYREGKDVFEACVLVSAATGEVLTEGTKGHPKAQEALVNHLKKVIRVK
ncbi:MAG: hypothetical protein ACTSWZ_07720 [Candidatus Heimdallarchaeaceae archaeon]